MVDYVKKHKAIDKERKKYSSHPSESSKGCNVSEPVRLDTATEEQCNPAYRVPRDVSEPARLDTATEEQYNPVYRVPRDVSEVARLEV